MHYIVIFESDHFDLAGEDPNPINPNHGQSVGLWMAPLLESRGLEVSEVLAEDWGWYLGATLGDRGYLVGFAGHPAEETGGASELIVQVGKHRSFWERITGKEKMDESDEVLALVVELVRSLDDATNIEIQKVP